MKIIRPLTITESMVQSSNAVEAYPAWVSTTTYALGAKVRRGSSVYESIQASNTNKDPAVELTWWLRLGPTNKMAMFDGQLINQTTATDEVIVHLKPELITGSIAVIGVTGLFVTVKVRDGSVSNPVVYESTASLQGDESSSWYQYFFDDPLLSSLIRTQAIFRGIPPLGDPYIEIRAWGVGPVAIGELILGRELYLGQTQYGLQSGIIDYSKKDTDEFGNTTFVPRAFSKRIEAEVWVPRLDINRVHRILQDARATPMVWIASDAPEYDGSAVVYGFYKDFSTQIAYPSYSVLSLEIEGLI